MYTKKLTTLRFSDARADLLANQGEGGGPLDCGRALLMAYVR